MTLLACRFPTLRRCGRICLICGKKLSPSDRIWTRRRSCQNSARHLKLIPNCWPEPWRNCWRKAACRGKTWRPSGCTDSRRVNIIRPLRPAAASRLRHRCLTRRGWRKSPGFLWFTIFVPTIFSMAAKARLWRRCTICTSVTPFPGAECFRSVLSTGEILPIWRWSAAARPCAKKSAAMTAGRSTTMRICWQRLFTAPILTKTASWRQADTLTACC